MKLKNKSATISYILLYTFYQFSLIIKGGTTWDDEQLINTTERIVTKYKIFVNDPASPFLSEFVSNYEFYGYLVLIPIYLFSRNENLINLFIYILNNFFKLDINNISEIEYYLRYISLAIYVSIVLIAIYFLYSKIQNSQNAMIFIILLTLIPSFSGHALFNIKDIPFAMQSTLAIFYFIYLLKNFNLLKINQILLSGVFFGFILLVRINGVAIIFSCLIFSLIWLYPRKEEIKNILSFWTIASISTLITFILGTPSAWQKPKLWLSQAIQTQFNIVVDSYVLNNGAFSVASSLPRHYLLKILFFKLPIIFHLSIIFIFYIIFKKLYKKNLILTYSIYFTFLVNIGFYVLTPVSYDGLRQYLFLIPFLCVILVETYFEMKLNKMIKLALLITFSTYLIGTQYGLSEFKYIYFNEFTDVKNLSIECDQIGGCGDWSTDYWGYSGKSIVNLLENNTIGAESIYFCEPSNVFIAFLAKEHVNDINKLIQKNNEFFIAYVHRPMFLNNILLDENNICGRLQNTKNVKCKNFLKYKTTLRREEVTLSYIDKCTVEF